MEVFADSSALVKLYSDEPGSERVHAFESVIISALAQVEVPSALWRKHRMGELKVEQVQILLNQFSYDCHAPVPVMPRFMIVGVNEMVISRASDIVAVHGLRANDAVQLATALIVRETVPESLAFAAFDTDLSQAAVREGLATIS